MVHTTDNSGVSDGWYQGFHSEPRGSNKPAWMLSVMSFVRSLATRRRLRCRKYHLTLRLRVSSIL
eukprot:8257302-Pyramimonas_sp.AAC.1